MGPGGPGLSITTPQGGATAMAALVRPCRAALCSIYENSKRLYQHLRHTIDPSHFVSEGQGFRKRFLILQLLRGHFAANQRFTAILRRFASILELQGTYLQGRSCVFG